MKIKLTNLFFLIFIAMKCIAQENPVTINGQVKSLKKTISNVHIINKTTGQGTFSNENGKFAMNVSLGDSILFSSIVYQNRIIKITNTHIHSKSMTVYLEPGLTELDVIELEQKIRTDWSNMSVPIGTVLDDDEITNKKPPNAEKLTNPISGNSGINFMNIFYLLTTKIRKKNKEKKREQKRILLLKNEFSEKIKVLYGDDFFIESLNIPKDEIYLFLDYCEGLGLKELYNNNEFQIKNFLVKQSVQFNLLKK